MAWLGGITPDYAAAAGGASHVGLAPSPQQAADVKRAPIEQQQQQPSDPPTITYSDLLHMLGGGGLNPVQLQPLPLQHVPGPAAAPAALGPRALPAGVGLSEHAASAAGAEVVAYVIPATTAEGVRCAPQQADGRGQLAEQIISERLHISSIWRDQQAGGDGGAAATGEAAAAADMGSRAATPLLPVLTPAPSLERLGSTVTMSHTLGDLLAAYQAEPNNSNQQVHGGLAEAAAAGTTVRGMTPPADAMATVQQQAAAAPQLFTAKPSSSAANSGYGESDGRTMADAMHMLVKE